MSKSATTTPMQLRLPEDLDERIAKIAGVNHLSKADVIRLCLSQAVPGIESNGLTILPSGKREEMSESKAA